jgi:hypothetical protein
MVFYPKLFIKARNHLKKLLMKNELFGAKTRENFFFLRKCKNHFNSMKHFTVIDTTV